MLITILFNDTHTIHPKIMNIPDDKDFQDIYEQAMSYAKADKYECMSHTIPDKYWIKAGASFPEPPVTIIEKDSVDVYVKNPDITLPLCRYCQHFEDGYCNKYGGCGDPDTLSDDCCIVNEKPPYMLTYNGYTIEYFIYRDNETSVDEVKNDMDSIIEHFFEDYKDVYKNPDAAIWDYINANTNENADEVTKHNYDKSLWDIL